MAGMDAHHSTRVGDDRPVVLHDDRPVLLGPPAAPQGPADPPRGRDGLRRAVLAGVAAGVVLAAALGGWLATRGDEDVATRPAPVAADPGPPAALSLTVDVPEEVVAGQPATLVVHYEDGVGLFSGSTEEWGDGVGTSSLQEARCGDAATTEAASGSYQATHTWAEPGTYTLTVGVSSYTCEAGAATEEQASRTVDVVVAAP